MYMLKKVFKMDFKKMNEIINRCSKKSGKNKFIIFIDMVLCLALYKAGYTDYEFFEFYKYKRKDRKTILTRGKNNDLVKKLNPKEYWDIIDDKVLFNEKFKDFLGRDYLKLDQNDFNSFKNFIKNKKEIIVKPIKETCGHGVEKINISDYKEKELFNKLIKNNQLLLEEVASQHKDMSNLHPTSVNTLRVITITNKNKITTIIGAVCRMGTNNKIVDNFHNDGICAPIDLEKGIINDKAISRTGELFTNHPTTNVKLVGYKIPKWNEVKKIVTESSKIVPELGFIGWDVYVGEKTVGLIEANHYPAYDLYKMIKTKDVGIIPTINDALNKK